MSQEKDVLHGYYVPSLRRSSRSPQYWRVRQNNITVPIQSMYECDTDLECPKYSYCLRMGCDGKEDTVENYRSKKYCTALINAPPTKPKNRQSLHQKLVETHSKKDFKFADHRYDSYEDLMQNTQGKNYPVLRKSNRKASLKKCNSPLYDDMRRREIIRDERSPYTRNYSSDPFDSKQYDFKKFPEKVVNDGILYLEDKIYNDYFRITDGNFEFKHGGTYEDLYGYRPDKRFYSDYDLETYRLEKREKDKDAFYSQYKRFPKSEEEFQAFIDKRVVY